MKETKQAQIERLQQALAFYADPATHEARTEDDRPVWPILNDKGQRARAALGIPEPPSFAERLAAISAPEELVPA
jgi:hypothetical protein